MYAVELPNELMTRLARVREVTRKAVAHQVRDAVLRYLEVEEPKLNREGSTE